MCKGIILNGESLYLLCGCYIIAQKGLDFKTPNQMAEDFYRLAA